MKVYWRKSIRLEKGLLLEMLNNKANNQKIAFIQQKIMKI